MNEYVSFLSHLAKRRLELGMSYVHIAKAAGLSVMTVQRILKGNFPRPQFSKGCGYRKHTQGAVGSERSPGSRVA